ncbi:40S ribosomal protein S29 [Armadillidium vulgare]|nr:40S ribosomal protein S29 [Armadillidium vulgare]
MSSTAKRCTKKLLKKVGTLYIVKRSSELSREIRSCSNRHGLIRKYGLNMCRQCFREYASDIGFKKLD